MVLQLADGFSKNEAVKALLKRSFEFREFMIDFHFLHGAEPCSVSSLQRNSCHEILKNEVESGDAVSILKTAYLNCYRKGFDLNELKL